ncbi:MAG: carboxypeptidase-like regulatory domain-containing protein, partial [Bacteroidota bacterium]
MSATRALLAVFVLSLLPAVAWAQVPTATLTGTVVDDETGEPLPGASVFIATSTRGDVVDTEGRFELRGVPVGAHRLYVSIIGFEPVAVDTLLREPRVYTFNFRLKPTVLELEGEVVVEAERDRRWQRRYERFKRLFIGET